METGEGAIAVKAHRTEKGVVIGACDSHLVGKSLKDRGLVLEITREFYFERHATADELSEMLEECATANLVGEKAVGAYCRRNPDAKSGVIRIGGVPHLQVFQL
jgi:hypothetical protein